MDIAGRLARIEKDLTKIKCILIGRAYSVAETENEVYRDLGPGLLEWVHEDAMCYKLSQAGVAFSEWSTDWQSKNGPP
ncbi:hypothetical protein Q31b_51690 [Novipirellula aureliae]|uniref:Uncharacterized protein n=2 Tax=Novipirellula aureliae TaxID=2527966 RepID=A0A5C6DI46_9BACT|nr:hypothetical protein Q31b_51690 [Novipirellula aureliae]